MKSLHIFFLFAAFVLAAVSCEKEPEITTEEPTERFGTFEIEFDNRAGNANLQLGTSEFIYTNANGDDLKVNELKYFISAIELVQADGTVHKDEMSSDGSKGFYLIDEADIETSLVKLENVPEAKYEELRFTVGVDGTQVEEGAQTGALDVTNNMFWNWNAGWIFVRFEGASTSSTEVDQEVTYNIGGYQDSAENPMLADNLITVTIPLGYEVQVADGRNPHAHLYIDILKLFEGPNMIDFSENSIRHSPVSCQELAENFPSAFSLDHIHE
ncbi:MAG: MbnP family protein [Bacteroidota bacterium]